MSYRRGEEEGRRREEEEGEEGRRGDTMSLSRT